MIPKPGQKFKYCGNEASNNQNLFWSDERVNMRVLEAKRFVIEYAGKNMSYSDWDVDDLVFNVYNKEDDGTLTDMRCKYIISEERFERFKKSFMEYGGNIIDHSRFPHKCIFCGQPAYIGGNNNCECSNKACELYC